MSRMCGITGIAPTRIDQKEQMRVHLLLFYIFLLTNGEKCITVLV